MDDTNDDILSSDFQVEEIVSSRSARGKTKYFIKWKDFPESENTWEQKDDLKKSGLGRELQKHDSLNLNREQTNQRRRKVKPIVLIQKPGRLTPTGKGREQELQRRISVRKAKELEELERKNKFEADVQAFRPPPATYLMTRILFLRSLASVYLTAFLVAFHQNPALIGDDGLLPAKDFWTRVNSTHQTNYPWDGFRAAPSLLWFLPTADVFSIVHSLAMLGVVLSSCVLFSGRANFFIMFILWSSYFTIDGVGQQWYVSSKKNFFIRFMLCYSV